MEHNDRLSKMEIAIIGFGDKFSEFLAVEAARTEREKQSIKEVAELKAKINDVDEKVTTFIEEYRLVDKPVVESARKWQGWFFWWSTRVVLPVILTSILYTAGANIYEKATLKKEAKQIKLSK